MLVYFYYFLFFIIIVISSYCFTIGAYNEAAVGFLGGIFNAYLVNNPEKLSKIAEYI